MADPEGKKDPGFDKKAKEKDAYSSGLADFMFRDLRPLPVLSIPPTRCTAVP